MAVYFIRAVDGGPIKIGKALDVVTRLVQHRNDTGKDLVALGVMDGYTELEKELHGRFSRYRIKRSEWFEPAQPIFDFIAVHAAPFDSYPPRKCMGTNFAGKACGAYATGDSDYCISHHPDHAKPPNAVLAFRLEDSLAKEAKKKAGWIPFSAVVRNLLEQWVSGKIEVDLTKE